MLFNLNFPQYALLSSFHFIAAPPYGAAVITLTGFTSAADLCNSSVHSQWRAGSGSERGGGEAFLF